MNKFKKIIGFLFFTIHDGLEHKKNFSITSFNFSKFNNENFFSNKYQLFYNIRNYFFNVIKYFAFPFLLILKILNYKIILVNPSSIGSCVEELDVVVKRNFEKNYKLILFCPKYFSHNIPVIKSLFSRNILLLYNPMWTIIITPLSFFKSITISPYFIPRDNKKIIFPKQYYSAKKNNIEFSYENFAHYILFKNLLKYENTKNKVGFQKNLKNYDDYFKQLKELYNLNFKICVVHLRNEDIYKHRNMNINNYYPAFDLLLESGYKIILYYNEKILEKYAHKILHFKNLNEVDKFNQLMFIYNCDLFIGNYSGPFHIVDIFKNDTIVLDTVVFNHFIRKKKFINVPKKYFDKKLKKFLNIDEIFNQNIECVWDEKILSKINIDPIDLTKDEILEVIKFYLNDDKNFFNISEFNFYKEIPHNENLAINKVPKLNSLKTIFEK